MPDLLLATCGFAASADPAANGSAIRAQMREAKAAGADLAHFHECAISGYAGPDIPNCDGIDWAGLRAATEEVQAEARELGLWVVVGSTHPLSAGRKPHNSLYIVRPDGSLADRYDKRFCAGPTDDAGYDSTRAWRRRAVEGRLHSGDLVQDPRSAERQTL